jgi:hypothetical protein
MLKIELINQGMQEDEANTKLKEFYDSFGYNIDIEVFKNIKMINSIFNNMINQLNNHDDNQEDDNYEDLDQEEDNQEDDNLLDNFMFNMLTHTFININLPEDVISTLNEEDKNNLKKYILENNLEDKCSICLDNFEKDQEVIELPCAHIHHSNCINEYLTKYNYKCPCCKVEVGRPVHNI